MTKVALWVRVSDPDQHTENQQPDPKRFGAARGWEVSQVYELQASAYKGDHQNVPSRVYQDAQQRKFDVLACWALDRLSREGQLATLQIVDRLGKSRVQVISVQEPWTEAAGELRDLRWPWWAGWPGSSLSGGLSGPGPDYKGLWPTVRRWVDLQVPKIGRSAAGQGISPGMLTDQIIVCGFCGPFHVNELGQALDQTKEPFSLLARGRHQHRGDHHPAGGEHLRHHQQRDRHRYSA